MEACNHRYFCLETWHHSGYRKISSPPSFIKFKQVLARKSTFLLWENIKVHLLLAYRNERDMPLASMIILLSCGWGIIAWTRQKISARKHLEMLATNMYLNTLRDGMSNRKCIAMHGTNQERHDSSVVSSFLQGYWRLNVSSRLRSVQVVLAPSSTSSVVSDYLQVVFQRPIFSVYSLD